MSELGETLRKARMEQGLSLEELEEMTKIRKRYLEAIEEQNFDILPGNFYVRAFIKNYAEAVGLNPDDILELYKNVIPQKPAPAAMEAVPRRRSPGLNVNFERWSKWLSAFLMICFFLLIVFLIYYYFYQSDSSHRDNVLDETPITNREIPPDSKNAGTGSAGPEETGTPASEDPEPEPAPEPEPEVTFVNTDGQTDIYTITGVEILKVELEITGKECWVEASKDNRNGEKLYSGMMFEGDTKTWEYEGSFSLRLGRASAASVTVNGIELKPFESANVRNLQFNFVENKQGRETGE